MTQDTPDLATLAAKLSEAQKRALVGEVRSIGNPERFVLCGEIHDRRMVPTLHALTRLGILEHGRFGKAMLTPLGLCLRNHLQQGSDA